MNLKRTNLRAFSALLVAGLALTVIPAPAQGAQTNFVSSDFTSYGLGGSSSSNMSASSQYYPTSSLAAGTLTWQLTTPNQWRAGSIFYKNRIDLTQDFAINAEIFLGKDSYPNNTLGGDGMAFVLQPTSATNLSGGGGLGYALMKPVLAVEYDTWVNAEFGDTNFSGDNLTDAWGILLKNTTEPDGVSNDSATLAANHTEFGVTVGAAKQFNAGQLEDEEWRKVSYEWVASTKSFTTKIDLNRDGDFGDTDESKSATIDLAAELGVSSVYWGFTAANGGVYNPHSVRFPANIEFSATARVNTAPTISDQANSSFLLSAGPQTFNFTLADDSTTQAQWQVTATSSSTSVATVTSSITGATSAQVEVTPAAVGSSNITVTVTDADGTSSSDTFTVTVTSSPGAPTSVTAVQVGLSASVSWTAPTNTGGLSISGYKVEISSDNGSSYSVAILNTGSSATTWTSNNLTVGTSYRFRVYAINSVGTSSASTASTALTIAATTPGAPSNVSVAYPGGTAPNIVTWNAPSDTGGSAITSYVIEYSTGSNWIALTATGLTAAIASNLVSINDSWQVRVAAVNVAGQGPWITWQNQPPIPYSGPVLTGFSTREFVAGRSSNLTLEGSNLSMIGEMFIGTTKLSFTREGEKLVANVPSLTAGTYDLRVVFTGGGVLTHQAALVVRSETVRESRVNVGSFNGRLVLYVAGQQGSTVTWRIGGRWGRAEVTSDFVRIDRPTPRRGVIVNVEVFVDGVRTLSRSVVTR